MFSGVDVLFQPGCVYVRGSHQLQHGPWIVEDPIADTSEPYRTPSGEMSHQLVPSTWTIHWQKISFQVTKWVRLGARKRSTEYLTKLADNATRFLCKFQQRRMACPCNQEKEIHRGLHWPLKAHRTHLWWFGALANSIHPFWPWNKKAKKDCFVPN